MGISVSGSGNNNALNFKGHLKSGNSTEHDKNTFLVTHCGRLGGFT